MSAACGSQAARKAQPKTTTTGTIKVNARAEFPAITAPTRPTTSKRTVARPHAVKATPAVRSHCAVVANSLTTLARIGVRVLPNGSIRTDKLAGVRTVASALAPLAGELSGSDRATILAADRAFLAWLRHLGHRTTPSQAQQETTVMVQALFKASAVCKKYVS